MSRINRCVKCREPFPNADPSRPILCESCDPMMQELEVALPDADLVQALANLLNASRGTGAERPVERLVSSLCVPMERRP